MGHLCALEQLAETCRNDQQARDLAWESEIVESLYAPVHVEGAALERYAGQYGERRFAIQDGALTKSSMGVPAQERANCQTG